MELLSPCGTIESLTAAIAAGADAVYFGLGELNARMKSTAFNLDNLRFYTDRCHLFGVKVYITLNTEVFDVELPRMRELVDFIYNAGCDAIISTDLAVLDYAKKTYPDFQIHVSTQSGVRNPSGAKFFKELGADRVVAARECGLKSLKSIAEVMETEAFIHGALCVSFSGNCLLSHYIGGNSANRGLCRQPCRKEYEAKDSRGNLLKKGYLLSAKDISMDAKIKDLERAKVSSLKIEGRLKSPEYVYVSTRHYRARIDNEKIDDEKELLTSYNRGGFAPAYLDGENVVYPLTSNHIGVKIGKIISIKVKNGFTFAEVNAKIVKGDGLKILRKGVEVGGSDVTSVEYKGDNSVVPVSRGVKAGDEVNITRSRVIADFVKAERPRLKAEMYLYFGEKAKLVAVNGDRQGEAETEYEEGLLSYEEILRQMEKTGETDFTLGSLTVEGKGYLPKSKLNRLRNEALSALSTAIINSYSRPKAVNYNRKSVERNLLLIGDIAEICRHQKVNERNVVYSPEFLNAERIAADLDLLVLDYERVYLKLPRLIGESEEKDYISLASKKGVGVYADNYGTVFLARENEVPFIAGIGLNVSNKVAVEALWDADAIIKSIETFSYENEDLYVFASGRLPLMTFEHCPMRTVRGNADCSTCKHKGESLVYNDGYASFPLKAVKANDRCYYTLYSDKPISISSGGKKYIVYE
ncbi:MAG: DUF3656 domain-containing protein [Clostridia bacterium]|nr:DUF3656 domain-containing protein [Clostridia bacterium]